MKVVCLISSEERRNAWIIYSSTPASTILPTSKVLEMRESSVIAHSFYSYLVEYSY